MTSLVQIEHHRRRVGDLRRWVTGLSAARMRLALTLLFLAVVVTSCGPHEPRVEATPSLAGTWVTDFIAPDGAHVGITNVIGTDGRCLCHTTQTLSNLVVTNEMGGTVEITNGYFIGTITNGSQRFPSRLLLVRLTDRELVLKYEGTDHEEIWTRQK
jgi:hypothetical protein